MNRHRCRDAIYRVHKRCSDAINRVPTYRRDSLVLFLKRPAEPTAAFKIQLIGKRDNKLTLIDERTLEQKIDLSPPVQGAAHDSVYEDWRELSFKTRENFPEYKFRIKIDVNNDYADKIEKNATQRIWVDVFVAVKLSEVREYKRRQSQYSGHL